MRKLLSFLLSIILVITLLGCNNSSVENSDAVDFYYIASEISYHEKDGYIASEKREVKELSEDLTELLNLYLCGPKSDEYISPFPSNTVVRSIEHNNGIFSIVLSSEFADLKGFDLSTACACLTITIQQLAETQLVQISAENAELDGNKSITMSTDSLVTYDDHTQNS